MDKFPSPRSVVGSVISRHIHLNEEISSTNTKHVWIARDTARNRNLVVKAVKSDLSFATINDVHRLWVAIGKSKESLKELLATFVTYAMTSQYKITILERYCATLEELMPSVQPLLESQIRSIGLQIITGIDFLHRSGIVHTNIKPSNIALINNETLEYVDYSRGFFIKRVVLKYPFIKIIDYDEAYVIRFGKGHHFIGTNGYRAPEVVLGPSWSFGVDVFSFGCLLAEMHLGKPIFRPTSTKLGFLVQVQRILGGISPLFIVRLKAAGLQSLLTTADELRGPISEAECADVASLSNDRPLAILISRPELFNLLQLALAPHEALRPAAYILMAHTYFKV